MSRLKLEKLVGCGDHVRGIVVTEKNYGRVMNHFARYVSAETSVLISRSGAETKHKIRLKIPGLGWRVAKVGDVVYRIAHTNTNHEVGIMKAIDSKGYQS